jgi:Na+/melibiose symporter-like transporter
LILAFGLLTVGYAMLWIVPRPAMVIAGVGLAAVALLVALLFYRPPDNLETRPRSVRNALQGLATVLRNGRFLALILITAGFWLIQGQMYASMPKYVLRMVGDAAMPEWYANVNPLVVVLCVVPVTQLVRKLAPIGSIAIALGLIPLSATIMGFSTPLGSLAAAAGLATHPVTIAMILGISLQGFAECFLSPRYLEYASKQAPPGQEGLYMGYAHINTFFAWFTGFVMSGPQDPSGGGPGRPPRRPRRPGADAGGLCTRPRHLVDLRDRRARRVRRALAPSVTVSNG